MRHLILISLLLLGMSWAVAQSDNKTATGKSGGQETVQGCLSNSGGTYALTAKDGKTFQLTGDTTKLTEHVGHEIKVTGTESAASESSGGTMGKTAEKTIEVTAVKHIAKSCEGKGSSSY